MKNLRAVTEDATTSDSPFGAQEAKQLARLTGKRAHYCPEWDYMAIDETCVEFEYCACKFED